MADPSPAEPSEGQAPEGREGQEPEQTDDPTPQEGEQGRTYAESYVKQLRRENASTRNENSELKEKLQEFEDRDNSELQRLQEQLASEKAAREAAELKQLRIDIAVEHGLDLQAAEYLTGHTREEIELRAEGLAKLLTDKGRPATGGFDGGARPTVPEQKSPEEAHNDLLLRSLGMQGRRP